MARKSNGPAIPVHSDETVMALINDRLDGKPMAVLAEKYGIKEHTIRRWCDGTVRGHLYDKVIDERHKLGKPI